jgi:cell shape-determining protein MreD
MIYIVYVLLGIFWIIVQTTIIPFVFHANDFFDLVIPLVLFISAYHPMEKGLFAVLGLGLMMDLLSGGTFGLFLMTYVLLYSIVEWIRPYLDTHSVVLLTFLILVGILIEDIIFFVIIGDFFSIVSTSVLRSFSLQLIWALLFGPLLLLLIYRVHEMSETRGNKNFLRMKIA